MIIAGGLVLFAGGCSGHEDVDLNICNLPEMRPRLPHNQSFRAAAHVSQIRRPASTPTASASPLSVAATQCRRHPVPRRSVSPASASPLSVVSQCLAAQCRRHPVYRSSVSPQPSVSPASSASPLSVAGQCRRPRCRRHPASPPPSASTLAAQPPTVLWSHSQSPRVVCNLLGYSRKIYDVAFTMPSRV
ncbi:hypothetical protein PR001_g7211 [Phytophthora rubi]|uniref:Uncharacterized protein n=1 Tax=Phytophthora rubi TaxID=129364 RepID=A0A6A3NEW7_9STRA|nr:hypothetical protein PR001_g7211 [Phytophthora rubi]